jgi:hypothetical protein
MPFLRSARGSAPLLAVAVVIGGLIASAAPAHAGAAPARPIDLHEDFHTCAVSPAAAPFVWSASPSLLAKFPDPSNAPLTGDFVVWPIAHPDQRIEYSGTGGAVPTLLGDGVGYGWKVRADNGTYKSPWSQTCYFTVDVTNPNVPVVTSPNYPPNTFSPGGAPVQLTFSPNGSTDVIGYQFSWTGGLFVIAARQGPDGFPVLPDPFQDTSRFVRSNAPDGSATFSLFPPAGTQFETLTVAAVDHAYNQSEATVYSFAVSSTAPGVTPATATPGWDTATTFTLTPNLGVPTVDSYSIQFNGGAAQTVPAGPGGTATIAITPNGPNRNDLLVTSHSVNGWVSSYGEWSLYYDTTPTVGSDVYLEEGSNPDTNGGVGIPGTFTFAPKVPNLVSYTYSFDSAPAVTVPAGADGTGQVTWAPDSSGTHLLSVSATAADGTVTDTYLYFFDVN